MRTVRTGPGATGDPHQYFSDISTPKWCYFNTTGNNSVVRQYWIRFIFWGIYKLIPRIKKLLKFLSKLNCKQYFYCLLWFLWSSGKGQARMGKGWPLRRKALKLKPLPRAYTKVGCHHPPPPPPSRKFNFTQLMARWGSGEAGGGKGRCVGSLWVTLGSLYVTLAYYRSP